MGDDLQAMVDRMTLNGCAGGPDVTEIAIAIEKRLGVSLGRQEYVQLAEHFVRLSLTKQQQQSQHPQQQQSQHPQQQQSQNGSSSSLGGVTDEEFNEHDSHKELTNHFVASGSSPKSETAGVQSVGTWSTSESTSSADEQHSQNLQPHGKNRADSDSSGTSQPRNRSPLPTPPLAQHPPARRPRPSSRSKSLTRNVRASPAPRTASENFAFDPFPRSTAVSYDHDVAFLDPFVQRPDTTSTIERNNFSEPVGNDFPSVVASPNKTTPPIRVQSPIRNAAPFRNASPIRSSSPIRRSSPIRNTTPQPLRSPAGVATPRVRSSASPLSGRPGLQEEDFQGITASPQRTSRGTPGREDYGANTTDTALHGNASASKGLFSNADEGQYNPGGFGEKCDPEPVPPADFSFRVDVSMSNTPIGDMFTPPPRGFTSNLSDDGAFKTGENKNRRKGSTPAINQTRSFSPSSSSAKSQSNSPSSSGFSRNQESNSSQAVRDNLEPPNLAPAGSLGTSIPGNASPLGNRANSEQQFGFGFESGQQRNGRRTVRVTRPQNSTNTTKETVSASGEKMTEATPRKMSSELDTMDLDSPTLVNAKFNFQEVSSFQIGCGGPINRVRARRLRRQNAPSTSMNLSHNPSQEGVTQSIVQPPHREELAFLDIKNAIFAIKEHARGYYVKGQYVESIQHYTHAIKVLSESPGRTQLSDLLAVLYSNRAAALMMIRAFEVACSDCKEGLPLVSKPGENGENFSGDSGPPLKVKLLTRLGRAYLKQGDHAVAFDAFNESISVANAAMEYSLKTSSPADHQHHATLLGQMITEASIGRSDADRLRGAMNEVAVAGQALQNDSLGRRACAEALSHVNTAMAIASGSLFLSVANISILARMKRWREVAGFCERIAASNSRMGGVFVGDLEGKCSFPLSDPPQHLQPDFFGDSREEDAEAAELKLNSRAAAEAVFWLPSSMLPLYLRALRLEERYPAAEACITAIETFVATVDSSTFPGAQLRRDFAWLPEERDKLFRTKTGREKGDELFRCGDFELAAAHYAVCLTIDSESILDSLDGPNAGGRLHAVLHCNRAACLMAMKRHKDALEECTAALRIHSRYMKAMLRRARCYSRLSRFQEAISEYQRWLDLVEEAKRTPAGSTVSITPCLFDCPKDVQPDSIKDAHSELEAVYSAKRKAEAAAREEAARRQERQHRWHNEFSASTSKSSWGDHDTAQQRREQWQNHQHESRRWDTFRGQGPRSQSANSRGRSSPWREAENTNNGSSRHRSAEARAPTDSSDHYTTLAVSVQASDEEIKRSYRRLALKFHPDKNKSADAEDKFHRIQAAYEVLSDPASRIKYNVEKGYQRRY